MDVWGSGAFLTRQSFTWMSSTLFVIQLMLMLLNYQSLHKGKYHLQKWHTISVVHLMPRSLHVISSTQAFSHFSTASDKCWEHKMRLVTLMCVWTFLSAACKSISCAGSSEQGSCEQRATGDENQKCLLRDHLQPISLNQCKRTTLLQYSIIPSPLPIAHWPYVRYCLWYHSLHFSQQSKESLYINKPRISTWANHAL